MPLSTIIHTKNAASTLKAALESVKDISDEIIIVDMESSDDTLKIAAKYTDLIFNHKDLGYADPARNFGLSKARHEWILVLDADEEIHDQLATFIRQVVAGEVEQNLQANAYYVPRKNILFGQWIEHSGWWPDHQVRLFKKGVVKWEVGVHRLPDINGSSVTLPAEECYAIIHHNYQHIHQYLDRMNRYTDLTAKETAEQMPDLTSYQLVKTFGDEFFRRYFAEAGMKDGLHGLSLSLLQASYQAVIKLKVWEQRGFPPRSEEQSALRALSGFRGELAYWIADWQVRQTSGLTSLLWRVRRKLKF